MRNIPQRKTCTGWRRSKSRATRAAFDAAFDVMAFQSDSISPGSAPLDLGDLIGLGAAGGDDFHGRAFLLADQRARQRRGDGDAALLGVGFRLADDLPHRLLLGVLVDQRYGGAKLDG